METEAGARASRLAGGAGGTGTYRILVAICAVNGACAIGFGALMMLVPLDAPLARSLDLAGLLAAMGNFPLQDAFFRDLFWPGLALALVNGTANAVATGLACLGRTRRAVATAGLAAGVCLIAWCAVELAFLPNPMAVGYLVIGLVQTAFAAQLRR